MFDYIKPFQATCPRCNEVVRFEGFQSKDGECLMKYLNFWEVDYFYGTCPKCGVWVNFERKRKDIVPIEEYEATIDK